MSPRPHLRPGLVALVAAGGAVGTSARYGLALALPHDGGWPVATFVANLFGAFLLGALLEALLRRGAESVGGRRARLGLGTGVLGGFTTFSSLALETDRLVAGGAAVTGVTYALATVVGGVLTCLAGVALAGARHRRRGGGGAR
ncbi:fluoride efflux transporter FluC [Pengzhenrongella sicca]|uniref:Fluoride-specific ion channel FluC n=1 Tax=Pengzhenrongella sicca TaxID=2819238 RepID=A0A8A4ZJW5_9MICO|nr:CrcB family protein [Pengzhenrongella sicca]QTE30827.1 CrcB family protein [Pengzhenrongella sicca]